MTRKFVELTKEFVKERLEKEGSGHDWWHTLRVYNNALDIAKTEKGDINLLIVELGALLHDIADYKFGYTDSDRNNIISNFLNSIKVEDNVIVNGKRFCNFFGIFLLLSFWQSTFHLFWQT